MRVTWLNTDPQFASARLRSLIPRDILRSHGLIEPGTDIVIAAKHGWNPLTVRHASKKMIMDVCDDHFSDQYAGHYRLACGIADAVTCNSEAMKLAILVNTGKVATVIDDPYEDPELEPTDGYGALWFGHSSNLPDLDAVASQIHCPLTVINNANYTADSLGEALKACKVTVIPTGKSRAKSANRAIRSIRYGKYPVCGPLPAHEELGLGIDGFEFALDNALASNMREPVLHLQNLIRDRFHPEKIAKDWLKVIHEA